MEHACTLTNEESKNCAQTMTQRESTVDRKMRDRESEQIKVTSEQGTMLTTATAQTHAKQAGEM